jgi:hypothetical protein
MHTTKLLAHSRQYQITAEYETVYLTLPDGQVVVIGDFYGDPRAALIAWHEQWCIIVGGGLLVYQLRAPFAPNTSPDANPQWTALFRTPHQEWWIEAVYQVSEETVRFVVDPATAQAGVYELHVPTFAVQRLIPANEHS